MSMPLISAFKRLDVREMLHSGHEPLTKICEEVAALPADAGLLVIAPFLPSPLIEKLESEGFSSKVEPGMGGVWMVYFWRSTE